MKDPELDQVVGNKMVVRNTSIDLTFPPILNTAFVVRQLVVIHKDSILPDLFKDIIKELSTLIESLMILTPTGKRILAALCSGLPSLGRDVSVAMYHVMGAEETLTNIVKELSLPYPNLEIKPDDTPMIELGIVLSRIWATAQGKLESAHKFAPTDETKYLASQWR